MGSIVFEGYRSEIKRMVAENRRIAIHASLEDIFNEGIEAGPKAVVELGVSELALANKVLTMVAEVNDAEFFSCDLFDFSKVCPYPKWRFHQGDDVDFAKIYDGPPIDLLFIDTNELYAHVCDEIKAWFPRLAEKATMMFRCTNLQKILHYEDGRSTGLGWDNERGVIRAIGDVLNIYFDETKPFEGKIGQWQIKHWPWGAGLTVLRKT